MLFYVMAVSVPALLTDATNLTIIFPLSRDSAETMGVGWHCFKRWYVFVIATGKKTVMQKEVFFFLMH